MKVIIVASLFIIPMVVIFLGSVMTGESCGSEISSTVRKKNNKIENKYIRALIG